MGGAPENQVVAFPQVAFAVALEESVSAPIAAGARRTKRTADRLRRDFGFMGFSVLVVRKDIDRIIQR